MLMAKDMVFIIWNLVHLLKFDLVLCWQAWVSYLFGYLLFTILSSLLHLELNQDAFYRIQFGLTLPCFHAIWACSYEPSIFGLEGRELQVFLWFLFQWMQHSAIKQFLWYSSFLTLSQAIPYLLPKFHEALRILRPHIPWACFYL